MFNFRIQLKAFFKNILSSPKNIVLFIWAFLLILGYIGMIVSNLSVKNSTNNIVITSSPSPTVKPSPTVSPTPYVQYKAPVSTPVPTILPSVTPTPAPNSISTSPTSSPNNNPDTTPPTIVQMTGPPDGSTVDFNSFCFPLYPHDDRTNANDILERRHFDSDTWSDWSKDTANCYSNVSNGQHTFAVEIKDEAGNTSGASRSFTVQVN